MARIKPSQTENQPNREELLQMAIRSAKAGNKEGARVMLRQVLSEDKRKERALLWMAKIATSKSERSQWLERVLEVNPDNAQAKSTLRKMTYKSSARENRTILIFGVVVVVLIVLAVLVYVALNLG